MDTISVSAWYEMAFRCRYLESRGNQFQDLFADIMERCHPEDFIRTRPWGSAGDRKNDGYLRSEKILFQAYAPNEMSEREALKKIEEDYLLALPHWQDYFDTWVFVHNATELGPGIIEKLLQLDQGNSNIAVRSWGFAELLQRVRQLEQADLIALFGPIPTRRDFLNLCVPELQAVLNHIAGQPVSTESEVGPVPVGKMDFNGLTPGIRSFLLAGRLRVRVVEEYFRTCSDPQLGDRIAEAFRQEYQKLRNQGLITDDIFAELQIFAGGQPPISTERSAAIWTVLTHLFDACDIFEHPRPEEPS